MEVNYVTYMLTQPETYVMIGITYFSVLGALIYNHRKLEKRYEEGLERGLEVGRLRAQVLGSN